MALTEMRHLVHHGQLLQVTATIHQTKEEQATEVDAGQCGPVVGQHQHQQLTGSRYKGRLSCGQVAIEGRREGGRNDQECIPEPRFGTYKKKQNLEPTRGSRATVQAKPINIRFNQLSLIMTSAKTVTPQLSMSLNQPPSKPPI